jgi:hypothetical protein
MKAWGRDMMDWAVLSGFNFNQTLPPYRTFPGGGCVENEFEIHGDIAFVKLPDWCRDYANWCSDDTDCTRTVAIDVSDLGIMDNATDKFWRYSSPGGLPAGVYLPQKRDVHKFVGLARLLLDAPCNTWRAFRDGDPLNCRRLNLLLLHHPPLQRDWLWSIALPVGFSEVRRSENYIMVKAAPDADQRLMWQYLLERWQFIRSRSIPLTIPRIHAHRTSCLRRISAIIQTEHQCVSMDIGDDGARENYRYDVRETEMAA